MTNLEELGRRAVACKHWRWMPGMLTADGCRMLAYESTREWSACSPDGSFCDPSQDSIPDLSDPATLGCLLALVREAWGDRAAWTDYWNGPLGGWFCAMGDVETDFFPNEAEALVAALEAAEALDHD